MANEQTHELKSIGTDPSFQGVTVHVKAKQQEPEESDFIKNVDFWAVNKVSNYKTITNFNDTTYTTPGDPENNLVKDELDKINTPQSGNWWERSQLTKFPKYLMMNLGGPFTNMENLRWMNIEKLFSNAYPGPNAVGFSISKTESAQMFFNNCKKLRWFDAVSGLKITKTCKNISYFFSKCEALELAIGLTTWDVGNVENMEYAFFNCKNLKSINISTWNTSAVKNFSSMFGSCENLEEINGVFDLTYAENCNNMFSGCTKLKKKIKFKNVPEGFDLTRTGLTTDQYEIVDGFHIDDMFYSENHGYRAANWYPLFGMEDDLDSHENSTVAPPDHL